MYYIKLVGLYGVIEIVAYYRKHGEGAFEFTNNIDHATPLTEQECRNIMDSKAWYLSIYGAMSMEMIPVSEFNVDLTKNN